MLTSYSFGERSSEQVNSADLFRLGNQEAVRLNTYRNGKVDHLLVAVVDCARDSCEDDSIFREETQHVDGNVSREEMNARKCLDTDFRRILCGTC